MMQVEAVESVLGISGESWMTTGWYGVAHTNSDMRLIGLAPKVVLKELSVSHVCSTELKLNRLYDLGTGLHVSHR